MHTLQTIKEACAQALRGNAANTTDASDAAAADARFHAVADPASVMEMASAIESLLTYMEKIDDLTARELVREVRHRLGDGGAEGGV